MAVHTLKAEIVEDGPYQFRWSIVNPETGVTLAVSSPTYTTEGGAERALALLAFMFDADRIENMPRWLHEVPGGC